MVIYIFSFRTYWSTTVKWLCAYYCEISWNLCCEMWFTVSLHCCHNSCHWYDFMPYKFIADYSNLMNLYSKIYYFALQFLTVKLKTITTLPVDIPQLIKQRLRLMGLIQGSQFKGVHYVHIHIHSHYGFDGTCVAYFCFHGKSAQLHFLFNVINVLIIKWSDATLIAKQGKERYELLKLELILTYRAIKISSSAAQKVKWVQ